MTAGASSPPPSVLDLVSERQAARERRDFARADALRDQVRAAGWMIRDNAAGADLVEAPEWEPLDPAATTPRWLPTAPRPTTRSCWWTTAPAPRSAGRSRTLPPPTAGSRCSTWTRRSASARP